MDKFWIVVTSVFVIGVIMVLFAGNGTSMNVKDLETECQYRNSPGQTVDIKADSLRFSGNFPVNNIQQEPKVSYSVSSNRITLEVDVSDVEEPESFYYNCLASVVYDVETDSKPGPGNYILSVVHDGEVAERRIVTLR
ncbi:MAG: hypothetical protein H8Z69_03480 [Nanohaloarchaea archaeon]|nr:hypothetical protein [Candidatus Nanohaloarchaea archaeon]